MRNGSNAIVLGGTNAHIELLKNLQDRGYYTVLVDYYDNPPAKRFADEHIRESTLDQEKVLEIALKIKADLVISTCIDQANVTACFVAEKMGLPAPYSYKTALNVTNKGLMKKTMMERGIPTSRYIYIEVMGEYRDNELKLPVVVKPADSTGSKGVRKANNLSELNLFLKDAFNLSRCNKAIVEEFTEGIEIQIDCYVQKRKAHIIMIRQKLKTLNHKESVMQSYGSLIPANVSQDIRVDIQQIANKIVEAYGLDNTPLMIQAIVNGKNINIIEFAPRVGGGLSYRIVKLISGFDILNSTINSFLGQHTRLVYNYPDSYYATYLIYTNPGVFSHISGFEDVLDNNIIEEIFFLKNRGMTVSPDMTSRDRVGAFIVKADNKQELFEKMKIAIDKLEVYDIEGNPMMRKDIFQLT